MTWPMAFVIVGVSLAVAIVLVGFMVATTWRQACKEADSAWVRTRPFK